MIRPLMVPTACAALMLAAAAGVADAEPSGWPCTYTLSPPHVVALSGTDVVTATLALTGCEAADSFLSVACIQVQGGEGPGRCEERNGPLTARVYFAPYQPGATYVSTGKGCATTGNPPQSFCQPSGPFTATL